MAGKGKKPQLIVRQVHVTAWFESTPGGRINATSEDGMPALIVLGGSEELRKLGMLLDRPDVRFDAPKATDDA